MSMPEMALVMFTLLLDSNLNVSLISLGGATVEYQVVATINDKANGDIVNVLTVDSDSIAHEIKQSALVNRFCKTYWVYYVIDGNELPGATQYMPGGYRRDPCRECCHRSH